MALKTLNTPGGFQQENDDVSEHDVEIDIREEEALIQLLENRPNIDGIFGEHDLQSEIDEAINSTGVHTDTSSNHRVGEPTCFSCTRKCKLKSGHDIKKGMHLIHERYFPINKLNDEISKVFSKASQILGSKKPFLYEHHVIVSEVIEPNDRTVTIKVVEFASVGSNTYAVIESEKPVVIDVKTDSHISYRQYGELKYTPDEIVERARSCIGKNAYHLLSNNCEHVAVWCVSGEKESFQAAATQDTKLRQVFTWIGSILGKITQFMVSDGIVFGSRVAKYALLSIPFIAFAGVFFLIELVINVLRFMQLNKQKKNGLICHACYNRRKNYLVAKVICSVLATIALAFIPMTSKAILTVMAIVLGIAGTYIFPAMFSFLYRKVKTVINPLYQIPKMIVRKHEQINPGDVLTIPSDHDIIVKNVKLLPRNQESGFVYLEIVHFTFPGPFSTRIVDKECIPFKIDKDKLNVFEFSSSEIVYSDDEVVRRALKKVGDQNFNALFYRSSHMSKFCKVRDYRTKYWRSPREIPATERKVSVASDVKPGDMINFNYFGIPHVGIVVGKLKPADVVEIDFYHVEGGKATRCKREIDLDTNNILRHSYAEEDRLSFENTLKKAEEKTGKEVYPFCLYKSSRLARDCVLKKKE